MPPGDLVVADYQWELRATLMGATTVFLPDLPGIAGLGEVVPKSNDVDLEGDDGAYATKDFDAPRVITIPMRISQSSPANAMNSFGTLKAVWAHSNAADIPLYIRLPGWGRFYVTGRPRGLKENLVDLKSSVIPVLATFFCPKPVITPAP